MGEGQCSKKSKREYEHTWELHNFIVVKCEFNCDDGKLEEGGRIELIMKLGNHGESRPHPQLLSFPTQQSAQVLGKFERISALEIRNQTPS